MKTKQWIGLLLSTALMGCGNNSAETDEVDHTLKEDKNLVQIAKSQVIQASNKLEFIRQMKSRTKRKLEEEKAKPAPDPVVIAEAERVLEHLEAENERLEREEAERLEAVKKRKSDNAKALSPGIAIRGILKEKQAELNADETTLAQLNALLTPYVDDPDSVQEHIPEILTQAKPILKNIKIKLPVRAISSEEFNIPHEELQRRVAAFSTRPDSPELRNRIFNVQEDLRTRYEGGDWLSIQAHVSQLTKETIIRKEYAQEVMDATVEKFLTDQQKLKLLEIYLRGDYQRQINGEDPTGFDYLVLLSLDPKSAVNNGLRVYFAHHFKRSLTPSEKIQLSQLTQLLSPAECTQLLNASDDSQIQDILKTWQAKIKTRNDRSINASLAKMPEERRDRFTALQGKMEEEALTEAEQAEYIKLYEYIDDISFSATLSLHTDDKIIEFLRGAIAYIKERGILFADTISLSANVPKDLSSNVSLRTARTALTGQLDARAFSLNGHQGTQLNLGLPLFVQLKGSVDGGKSTDATTGSVAYRLGNTVIGAIQAYANSGNGFGLDGRQLETSVVASHSFGGFFVEGQLGAVSANNVHTADWSGVRSQVTLGVDTQFVSPFIQVAYRQLDRNHTYALNDTAAYVGLDVEVAGLTMDAYRMDTRLLTKVGVGSKDWTHGSKAVGSITGFEGSVEWSGSLTLNSGVSFSTNLGLDTVAGSAAKFNISVER